MLLCIYSISLLQVRKRKLEAPTGEIDVHQIDNTLLLPGNILKTQKMLRSKLLEALELSQTKNTHPEELLRMNKELLACSRRLSRYLRLLEQKLNAFWHLGGVRDTCSTVFSQLLQINRCLKEQLSEQAQQGKFLGMHGPELSAYKKTLIDLQELEGPLQDDMFKVKQQLQVAKASFASPPTHNGWRKRQRVYSNVRHNEATVAPVRETWETMVEEKVENLEQTLEKQGKKLEELVDENKTLKAELQSLRKAHKLVEGNVF